MIALLIAVSVSMGVYFWAQDMPWRVQYSLDWGPYNGPWFPLHLAGWVIAIVAIGIALSVIHWWYQWQLYSRRNMLLGIPHQWHQEQEARICGQ